jgi:lysine biosynthesis protein LysW
LNEAIRPEFRDLFYVNLLRNRYRRKTDMQFTCVDCGGFIELPDDCVPDEIVGCPDCGLDYVVVEEESGLLLLKELTIEGEDWGE